MTKKERAKRYFEIGQTYKKKSELEFECRLLIHEMYKHLSKRTKKWVNKENFDSVINQNSAYIVVNLGDKKYQIPVSGARTLSNWSTNTFTIFRTFRQSYYAFCFEITDTPNCWDDDFTFKEIMEVIESYARNKALRKEREESPRL